MSEARYIVGDVFEQMAKLPDGSVDCVITSPPFLALRSYLPADHPDKAKEIGSEATPPAFLSTLLKLTEEWRRILAPHGSICVELGDTYSGSGGAGGDYNDGGLREGQERYGGSKKQGRSTVTDGDPTWRNLDGYYETRFNGARGGPGWPLPKSLCGIPDAYALSLEYGWNMLNPTEQCDRMRVRNKIVWHRPNPPVGALGDKVRPSTSYITIACISGSRWFDLDAERTAAQGQSDYPSNGPKAAAREAAGIDGIGRYAARIDSNPAGAPPLDCWTIPTAPYVTPDGLIVVPSGGTAHRVRVQAGVGGDGIQRTTSPSCPVHGSPDHRGSSAPDGGHGAGASSRNGHTDVGHVPAPSVGSLSRPLTLDLPGSDAAPDAPAATPHSTTSSRTALAHATTPPGMPSAQTPDRTFYISGEPVSSVLRLGTPESSTESGGLGDDPGPRSELHIADNPSEPAERACTCSYWVDVDVTSEDTSDYATFPPDLWNIPTHGFAGAHYATFPPALPRKLINLMCPRQVCTQCGEPRRRIVEATDEYAERLGKSWADTTEGRTKAANTVRNSHSAAAGLKGMNGAAYNTVGWSDCGHNTWRRGVVLDPFAGSGTTLMAASELGRDSIGIDLDARNLDLARERLGLFLAEVVS